MNDQQLKTILMETYPALPGQEARAWTLLQERMQKPASLPAWRPVFAGIAAVACAIVLAAHFDSPAIAPLSASSQSPGIFATAFYSQNAHAQVVWLNGMEPATDGPTYMDPSSQVDESAAAPDSL